MLDMTFGDDLIPMYFYNRLTDITPGDLKAMGVRGVAVDVDNTIAVDSLNIIFKGVPQWIEKIKNAGFPVFILSNTYETRAKTLSRRLGDIPYLANSHKPKKEGYLQAAKTLGIEIHELAMIGDQLFTDIKGANHVGAVSVRVRPVHKEFFLPVHYIPLRRRERQFLRMKGLGDKI